jgi:uncharacterized protein GlcG (DUF336 family)
MTISRPLASITAAAAQRAVAAAIARGAERGAAVVAVVVDQAGDMVACVRADGAFSASVDIARDKARTAAIFRLSTDTLCAALAHNEVLRQGIAQRPGVILFGGGLPITENGQVIGAIGVSGGAEDDDRACAAAGVAALATITSEGDRV